MGFQGIAGRAKCYFFAAISIQIFFATTANSQSYTFATFEGVSGTRPFYFTNYGNSAFIGAGPLGTSGFGMPVTFRFTSATGLPTTDHQAYFNMSAELGISVHNGATITSGTHFDQPTTTSFRTMLGFQGSSDGSLLFGSYYEGDIVGNLGDTTATFTGTLDQQFWLIESDYLKFSAVNLTDTFSFTLTNITPALSINPTGGILNSFTADISGQLSGSPTPAPEPTSLASLALAGAACGLRRTRHSRMA